MIVDEGKYYLYRHIRLDTNEVFYVGIGRKRKERICNSFSQEFERAFCRNRNNLWKKITNKTDYQVEILLQTDSEEFIIAKEIEFIKLYGRKDLGLGTLANLTDGGEGLLNPSFETKQKIANKIKGIKRSEKTKILIQKAVLGSKKGPRLEKTKKLISLKNSGTKNGMFGITGNKNKKSKPVLQYSITGEFVKEWVNAREINKELGLDYKYISACCTNKQKTAKGFIWKYKNGY